VTSKNIIPPNLPIKILVTQFIYLTIKTSIKLYGQKK
jgi:hypothetical protein